MISIIFALFTLFSCSKSDTTSIVGKWYNYSIDTKKTTGVGCTLKDTTKLYTKNVDAQVYEFFADGKVNITMYINSVAYPGSGTYKLENSNLTLTYGSGQSITMALSNINSEGWRYLQQNFVWCPSKTAFNEYYNFKKY